MVDRVQELETEVLSLDAADRARLLERLLESFEPVEKWQESWLAEAARRAQEVDLGPVALVPGQEALARIRARIA